MWINAVIANYRLHRRDRDCYQEISGPSRAILLIKYFFILNRITGSFIGAWE